MSDTLLNIDAYIKAFPAEVQLCLEQLRATIQKAAPGVEECISYGIPTFKLGRKTLVHFAGYRRHIGFYPAPSALKAFSGDISLYKSSKGAVQFPLNRPMPLELISRMVIFRVQEISS